MPEQWVFADDGHSGASLVRPSLERLRDIVAGVGVDVVLCYAPDRLARKFALQALLIEEFTRAGTKVEFVRGPRFDGRCVRPERRNRIVARHRESDRVVPVFAVIRSTK
ncbi:recombinase family protein [Nocardia sp. NPDC052278]|uniref:recombinase family protein n=1 Tax=unclassified Nocardia TaxID=2637762 RepID=UPI0036950692